MMKLPLLRYTALALMVSLAAFLFASAVLAGTQTGPSFVVNTMADTNDGSCDALGQGTGDQFGFSGRTGGSKERAVIDNVQLAPR